MRMTRWYTKEEIQFVKDNIRGRSYADMTRLFNECFGLRITLKQMKTLAYKHKLYNGLGTINGYAPPNKGKKHKPQQGNYRPVGTERVISGYVEIKTGHSVWDRKHTAIWKAANGKVPKGHVVIFADGNRRNFDLDNLLLVSRKEIAVMNHERLIGANRELTVIGKTIADLKIAISKRERKLKRGQ